MVSSTWRSRAIKHQVFDVNIIPITTIITLVAIGT